MINEKILTTQTNYLSNIFNVIWWQCLFFRLFRICHTNENELVTNIKTVLDNTITNNITKKVLKFLLLHLNRIAENEKNMMTAENLAIVFSPNLFHNMTNSRRPESVMSEIELGNFTVSHLIKYATEIFE